MIKGVTLRDRLRNDDIRNELDVESIVLFIEKSQLKWYGHVMRMEETRQPVKYHKWTLDDRSPVRRPRNRWKDAVQGAVIARGETLEHVEESELYADRKEWRTFMRHHN